MELADCVLAKSIPLHTFKKHL